MPLYRMTGIFPSSAWRRSYVSLRLTTFVWGLSQQNKCSCAIVNSLPCGGGPWPAMVECKWRQREAKRKTNLLLRVTRYEEEWQNRKGGGVQHGAMICRTGIYDVFFYSHRPSGRVFTVIENTLQPLADLGASHTRRNDWGGRRVTTHPILYLIAAE